jgi:hypothetical protein
MRIVTWILAVVVATAACSVPFGPPSGVRSFEGRQFFPLSVGSWWLYRVEDRARGWTFARRIAVARYERIRALGHEAAVVEERILGLRGPLARWPSQPVAYFWRDGYLREVYLTERSGETVPLEGLWETLLLPERVGEAFLWNGVEMGARQVAILWAEQSRRLDPGPATERVPAGTFRDCIRVDTVAVYRGDPQGDERYAFFHSDWYAPGVGLVRSQTWSDPERRRERVRMELVAFWIAGSDPGTAARCSLCPRREGVRRLPRRPRR